MYKKNIAWLIVAIMITQSFVSLLSWISVYAKIPGDYQANSGLAKIWESITKDFIKIQSQKKLGERPSTDVFSRLNNSFSFIFPKLPQKNNYKIIFEQCTSLAGKLSWGYNNIDFDAFVDQCQSPLVTIMKDISSNYSIKAKIKANPSSGPAPHTVTFDARDSNDPSKDTIPSNNFFRYYKNNKGDDVLIGRWATTKHTFEEEGNYLVHLTVRSINNISQWILDGEADTSINVAPETANVIVYANGKKLQNKTYTKIGTFEAQKWTIFDASPTQPKGSREIIKHRREISWPNGFRFQSEEFPTKPSSINMKLPTNGAYTITLAITDNEGNLTTKTFLVAVSDPIAIIKQTPENPTTSTVIKFDGSTSYAIQSRIKQYSRELFDEKGEKMFASQTKNFSRSFNKPGTYTVKLKITDDLWQSNEESNTVFVDSTEPQAVFTSTSRLDRELPSQFILDASPSNDKDVTAWNDALKYERSFVNNSQVKIEQRYDDDKSIVVSFSDPGIYPVKLIVSDSYGKINTLERSIEVKSALRPVIYAAPRATVRGQNIRFIVKSNDDIISYDRDFGDGTKSTLQVPTTTKSFSKAGIYNVKLTVVGKKWQKNSVKTQVFVGEKDSPVGAYTVINSAQNILKPTETCSGESAFLLKRLEKINIDITDSVNARWEKQNLESYFQPINDEIYKSNRFQYSFKRIGCQYIDTIVEDTTTSKNDKIRIWFKVVNDLPTLNSLSLVFPQFGNEVGVGLWQGSKSKTFDPNSVSPLIIKVNAVGPKDNDGFITQYIWYYYKKDDPSRKLELKPTPANSPNTFFTIYSDPGEIVFGVKMVDNDGWEQTSESVIGQWPTLFIPPQGDKNMDIPIVSLLVNKVNISVGEEVTFTTKAKILSARWDFDAKKTIQYDFDGDGIRDKTTKDNTVTYVYTKSSSNSIRPRVQVTYRWFPVISDGDDLTIKDDLKALIQYAIYGKTIIARDYSYGQIEKRELCFDSRIACLSWATIFSGEYSSINYSETGQHIVSFSVGDRYGNNSNIRQLVNVTDPENPENPYILSLPQAKKQNGIYAISVGQQSKNSVLMNIINTEKGICYMDKDISDDNDNDGNPANDKDVSCNEAIMVSYAPLTNTITSRVVYETTIQWERKLVSHDIAVNFIDQEVSISPDQDKLYKRINAVANSVSLDTQAGKDLKILLNQLTQSIIIKKDPIAIILEIRDFLQKNPDWLIEKQSKELNAILDEMSTGETVSAMWWNPYQQAKATIIQFAPDTIKINVKDIFGYIDKMESPSSESEKVKKYLVQLLDLLKKNSVKDSELSKPGNENKIAESDIETIIMPKICQILSFYNIASMQCRSTQEGGGGDLTQWSLQKVTDGTTSTLSTVLKRVGIITGILLWIFLIVVVFFAIKAKIQQNEDEEEHVA